MEKIISLHFLVLTTSIITNLPDVASCKDQAVFVMLSRLWTAPQRVCLYPKEPFLDFNVPPRCLSRVFFKISLSINHSHFYPLSTTHPPTTTSTIIITTTTTISPAQSTPAAQFLLHQEILKGGPFFTSPKQMSSQEDSILCRNWEPQRRCRRPLNRWCHKSLPKSDPTI